MKHVLIFAAMVAVPLLAGDPWKDKKPAEWNEKEVQAVLTRSPWAKEVSVTLGVAGGNMPSSGGTRSGPKRSASDWGAAMPSAGGAAGPGDMGERRPTLEASFQVRWLGAPVREALAIAKQPAIRPELFEQFYVLTVFRAGGNPRPGQPQGLSQEQTAQLKQVTSLHRKSGDPVPPEMVGQVMSNEGSITVFLFPRKAGFSPEDGSIEFRTHLGPAEIKTKFDVKKMVWNGAPAL